MWFKKINNRLMRLYSNSGRNYGAIAFGVDSGGKFVVIGKQSELTRDSLFTDGSASNYGIGSICLGSPLRIVDGDGLWQAVTATAASQSVSPSHSVSPSSSASVSVSPSTSPSLSPSASASRSVSPSASASPSA